MSALKILVFSVDDFPYGSDYILCRQSIFLSQIVLVADLAESVVNSDEFDRNWAAACRCFADGST